MKQQVIQAIRNEPLVSEVVHCPFCGVLNLDFLTEGEPQVVECPHLLFVGDDDFCHYLSDRFLRSVGLTPEDKDDMYGKSAWPLIDKCFLADSFYFYGQQGAYLVYIGYAAT